jgi:hypothetical protein
MEEHKELLDMLTAMSDEEFWTWVGSWYDVEFIMDTVRNWDEATVHETLIELKEAKANEHREKDRAAEKDQKL